MYILSDVMFTDGKFKVATISLPSHAIDEIYFTIIRFVMYTHDRDTYLYNNY